jgi:glutathione S-transferase
MKLYYSPGACSLAVHIILSEAGYRYDTEKVDLKTKKTASGKDFTAINDKGYVPALTLDSGETLTEASSVLQYLADSKPESNLAPKPGTMERVRLNEWLNFISTELHKGIGALWSKVNDEADAATRKKAATRLEYLEGKLKGREYLAGKNFTIADAYLHNILLWTKPLNVDISAYPSIVAYQARISARPGVQKAMQEEGLIKAAA